MQRGRGMRGKGRRPAKVEVQRGRGMRGREGPVPHPCHSNVDLPENPMSLFNPILYLFSAQTFYYCLFLVIFISFVGSRPSDHYFCSVCLFVFAEFFSAVFGPISIKLGHMLYVWV